MLALSPGFFLAVSNTTKHKLINQDEFEWIHFTAAMKRRRYFKKKTDLCRFFLSEDKLTCRPGWLFF